MDAFRHKAARDMYGFNKYVASVLLYIEDVLDHARNAGGLYALEAMMRQFRSAFRRDLTLREFLSIERILQDEFHVTG